MGNCETMCETIDKPAVSTVFISEKSEQKEPNKLHKNILEARSQLQEYPRVPALIKTRMQNLQSMDYNSQYSSLLEQTKIWKVKIHGYRFCYINEAEHQDAEPRGMCIVYMYKEKGEFLWYFHGVIDENFRQLTTNAVYIFANGSYFQGDRKKANYGLYVNENINYRYEGQWCDHQPHGNGKEESAKGTYEGIFWKGKKEGKGEFKFGDSELIYEGDFKEDQIEGKGKLFKGGDCIYQGHFIKGAKHGYGREHDEGKIYEGYFRHNQKSGEGKLILQRKTMQFEGEFLNNQPNGRGCLQLGNEKIEGVWKDGELIVLLNQISQGRIK